MNKIFLLILVSNSILIGMDKKRILEPDSSKPKNVTFSQDALAKLAITQEAIAVVNNPLTPPSIPRTKLSPDARYTCPELGLNKLTMPHRDSVPDIDGQTVASVRKPKMSRDDQNTIQ